MRYLLDANVFIQAHRFHYPFDVFPAFWGWLEQENTMGSIGSIDWVYNEINDGGDPLADWVKTQDLERWFLPCDDETTQQCYIDIANEIMGATHYTDSAKAEFLAKADSWLIAKAKSLKLTIVTEERSHPQRRNKIFIPDICGIYEIPCMNTVDLIRELGGLFK